MNNTSEFRKLTNLRKVFNNPRNLEISKSKMDKLGNSPHKRSSKIFTKFLRFIDLNLEKGFLDSRAAHQLSFFRFLCFTLALLYSAIFSVNPFKAEFQSTIYLITFLSTLSIIGVAYLIVVYKLPKCGECGMALTSFFYVIFVGETFKLLIQNLEEKIEHRWTTDVMLLVIGVFMIGSRVRWLYCGVTLLLLNSYISIRVWNDIINPNRVLPTILGMLAYGFLIPVINYSNELNDRNFFYLVHQKGENLKAFHLLIKDILPSSMILLDGERIQFFNNRIREMFGVKNDHDLVNMMKTIEVNK